MAKKELTPEAQCLYCGKNVQSEDVFTDETGKSFCSQEHAEIYAQTMRTINNTY